jgi:indolepyruvate ferredoxin oxidoreductase
VAFQSGEIPVSIEAFEQAIELNGVAVEANVAAFGWGRRWFADQEKVESLVTGSGLGELEVSVEPLSSSLAVRVDQFGLDQDLLALVTMLASDLVAYQDEAYAGRFITLVALAVGTGNPNLVEAVARNGHKLMAYKDEYEVARLMLAEDGLSALAAVPGVGAKPQFSWQLHPPMLRALGMDRKLSFGSRSRPLFKALAKGKKLRGTSKDPFGRAELRKIERAMIGEYESAISGVCVALQAGSIDPASAIEIAGLPDQVRGYEDLKLQRATDYRAELAGKLVAFA